MGVFDDFLSSTNVLDTRLPTTALDRSTLIELKEWITRGDAEYPDAAAYADEVHTVEEDAIDHTGGSFSLVFNLQGGVSFTASNIDHDAIGSTIESAVDTAAAGVDQVQTIAQDLTDYILGTFTLTFNLESGEQFTTAAIAFNATAGIIETAINLAASGVVTGWTNGDISVSGGILQLVGSPVVLTFSGNSVSNANHELVVFDETLLIGGSEPPTRVSITTPGNAPVLGWTNGNISVSGGPLQSNQLVITFSGPLVTGKVHLLTEFDGSLLTGGTEPATRIVRTKPGQPFRAAWAVLILMGVVSPADVPVYGESPKLFPRLNNDKSNYPSQNLIKAIAEEAALHDNNIDTRIKILESVGLI